MQSIVSAMHDPAWDKDRFELIKQQLIRQKNNVKRDYPFRQVISFFYSIVESRWTSVDQATAMDDIGFDQLQQFSSRLLSSFDAKVLITGNYKQDSLDSILNQLTVMKFSHRDLSAKVARLEQVDISASMAVDHRDAVLVQYIQADNDSIEERATLGLLSQMISAPFYNQLRTQKQLGYVVSAFAMPINRVPGICMIVQSPVASSQQLQAEFITFNQTFSLHIDKLSNEELERHKRALLVNIQKSPDNLSELNARHLQSIMLGYKDFDFRDQLAQAINSISVADIKAAYQRLVLNKPRRLWVHTHDKVSAKSAADSKLLIDQHYMFPY